MSELSPPDVILTHESDLDGFVSGLLLQRLAKQRFGTDVKLEAWNYQGWKNRQMSERVAWVSDFTFETRLDKSGWLVVDHHTTTNAPKQAQLIHDVTKSAGLLVYELCRADGVASPALDRLVQLNNIADLFLEDDPDFVTAQDYASLVKTYGFWDLHAVLGGDLEKLIDHPLLEVIQVKRRIEDPIGYDWSRQHVTAVTKQLGYVETCVGNTNLIVYQLLDREATSHTTLVTLFRKANGLIVASFRSRDGSALKIASQFQGGGHPNAAGATLPRSVMSTKDAVDYLRKMLTTGSAPQGGGLNSLDSLLAGFQPKAS
jgi:oligoribonuclease NrnB/cAMP/cGMP phosphodiesterase (DHH superfamily)